MASTTAEPPDAAAAGAPSPEVKIADAATGREPLDDIELVESEDEEPATGPEEVRRWALELCQSAEQLLDEGEIEDALSRPRPGLRADAGSCRTNGDDANLQAKEDIRLLVAELVTRALRRRRRRREPGSTSGI